MAFGRQQTPFRSVKAYQRALDTMGKLAAEQAGTPRPATPADPAGPLEPDSPYVRVVSDDAAPPAPPRPPSLRPRSRRTRQAQAVPATDVPTPGPNTRVVGAEEPSSAALTAGPDGLPPQLTVPPPVATEAYRSDRGDGAVHPVPDVVGNGTAPQPGAAGPEMLHFDDLAVARDGVGSTAPKSWADVQPSQPDRGGRSRSARSRRGSPIFRASGRGPLRHPWVALVAAAVLLIGGVVLGLTLPGSARSHGRQPAATAHAAPPQSVTPASADNASPSTAPPTTAPSAILVASSIGMSTYRVGTSATITLVANNGPCWIEIRQSGPYGPVMYMGLIMAGQSRQMTGQVWVRLGNPGAITVNGTSISPPGMTAGQPYNLQFA